jgi:glycosyltransferase involved in cell wall biosynthesis
MPAYNEADHIWNSVADVEKQFGAVFGDYEIIVVNDGSTDGTKKLVKSLENERVRIVSYDRNEGKGHALRKGFCRATGEFTFLVDSDAEIRAKDLAAYVRVLNLADIAIGSKRHADSVVRTPVIRRFLSLGFNIFERLLTGVRIGDSQAGFKAAKSQVLYQVLPLLTAKRYSFDLELLAVASLLKFNIRELPVCIDLKGSFDAKQVFRMMVDVFGIAYRLKLTRWYQKNILNMSDTYYPMIRW